MKFYRVQILTQGGGHVSMEFFAKDRDDAIKFAKRQNRIIFKRVLSARVIRPEEALAPERPEMGYARRIA